MSARVARGLTTVIDTLGLDPDRRRAWLAAARTAGLPAVAVVLDTPGEECRRRNRLRDRPVPATTLAEQVRRVAAVHDVVAAEGWDGVEVVGADPVLSTRSGPPPSAPEPNATHGLRVVLQLSRFPWGEDPGEWVRETALAASTAGFAGIALMDHLIQIPQVDSPWQPIPRLRQPFSDSDDLRARPEDHCRGGAGRPLCRR